MSVFIFIFFKNTFNSHWLLTKFSWDHKTYTGPTHTSKILLLSQPPCPLPKQFSKLKVVLPQIHGFQLALPERWGSWSLTASGHTDRFPLYLPQLLNHESTHFYMSQEGPMESKSVSMYLRKGHKKAELFLYLLLFDFILLFQSYPWHVRSCACVYVSPPHWASNTLNE